MRKIRLGSVLVFFGFAVPAVGQGPENITRESVEISPFYGYRTGGSMTGELDGSVAEFAIESGGSYGGTLDINLNKGNFKLEVRYSHHDTELDTTGLVLRAPLQVDYLHAGILQETGSEKSRFFVSALVGATRFSPQSFDTITKFSLSIGGGVKLFIGRNFGIRLEGRGYLTFVETDAGAFCANGTCLFAFGGSNMWQGELTGGLILAF